MNVNEIFLSVQGEGLTAGFPTIFVRFTGCNLRCSYCDTTYSYNEGVEQTVSQVFEEIQKLHYKRVCLTGGEPLLQSELPMLLEMLVDYKVTIETNGSIALKILNNVLHSYVMDLKSPSSGHSGDMKLENLNTLTNRDEIKFVVGTREDYEWAKEIIQNRFFKGTVTLSPIFNKISYKELIQWILEDKLDARFQLQLHKIVWQPDARGV